MAEEPTSRVENAGPVSAEDEMTLNSREVRNGVSGYRGGPLELDADTRS
jgi:hypothetical protein